MGFHPIIQKFFDTMAFAKDHFFAFIDLRVVAIGQAQIEIDKLNSKEKEMCFKDFDIALSHLKNMGLIYNYEAIKDGFKIFPQDKNYIDENHLKLLFTKEQDYDVA